MQRIFIHRATMAGVAAAAIGVASGSLAQTKPLAVSDVERQEAAQTYKVMCITCHGEKGRGDGPASTALNPKPADFSSLAWQDKIKDAAIEKVILEGGQAAGKSFLMPPNPQLKGKPGVVAALREMVRGFAALRK